MLSAPTRMAPAASSRSISAASRAAGGSVAIDLRAGERRQTRDVEQILHRERHAGERAELFCLCARASSMRLRARQRALLGDRGEGIEQRIALADTGQRRLDDAASRWRGRLRPRRRYRPTLLQPRSAAGMSSMEHRPGLGIVGQRNSSTSAREAQDQSQIELDAARHAGSIVRPSACALGQQTSASMAIALRARLGVSARLACATSAWPRLALRAGLRACVLRSLRFMSLSGFGRNSSAKWHATCRAPKRRSAGIVVLHESVPRGQRP